MKLVYAYAGFSLGVALYFFYLTAAGLRTPDMQIGAYVVNLTTLVVTAYIAFTLYVIYGLTKRRS
ncbi:MAG: hypothetical protein ABWK05_08080 [Pyrobaculum sp.]